MIDKFQTIPTRTLLLFAMLTLVVACNRDSATPTFNSGARIAPALSAKSVSRIQIDLSWQSVRGAGYYRLYRNASGKVVTTTPMPQEAALTDSDAFRGELLYAGDGAQLSTDSGVSFLYNDTSIVAGEDYFYSIGICIDEDPELCFFTPNSGETSISPGGLPVEGFFIRDLEAGFSDGQIDLSWSAPDSGVVFYFLYRTEIDQKTHEGISDREQIYLGATAGYTDTQVKPGRLLAYFYSVVACLSKTLGPHCGPESDSEIISYSYLLTGVPDKPSPPSAVAATATMINLSWEAVEPGRFYRLFQIRESATAADRIAPVYMGRKLNFSDTVNTGGIYSYTLRTCVDMNLSSCSLFSPLTEVDTTMPTPTSRPPDAVALNAEQIHISWDDNRFHHFQLFRADSRASPGELIYAGPGLSVTDVAPSSDASHFYTLRACLDSSQSQCQNFSTPVVVSTGSVPQSP